MKKQTLAGIFVIACVAMCAAVWPWNAEVEDLPAEPVKSAVSAEIEARSEQIPQIFIPVDSLNPELEATAESKSPKTDITAEEKTETAPPATPKLLKTQAQPLSNPKSGDRAIIDGRPHIWIPGFGWIVDECGGSNGILVDGEGDINKQVGVMGGGKTVGNPGDELTGNKVGIMGGGTVAADMYENGHKIGIMGGSEPQSREATTQAIRTGGTNRRSRIHRTGQNADEEQHSAAVQTQRSSAESVRNTKGAPSPKTFQAECAPFLCSSSIDLVRCHRTITFFHKSL